MEDWKDQTEVYSLGKILVRMKAINNNELQETIKRQNGQKIGQMLLQDKKITDEQLKVGLHLQKNLRSNTPYKKAMAAAELARISAKKVLEFANSMKSKVLKTKKKITGEDNPVINDAMLDENNQVS